MGCFVQGKKSVWDVLSIPSDQCGMFCPPWRSSVGSFVHPTKNGMGAFVHGIFCLAPQSSYSLAISCYYMLSRKIMYADRHTVSQSTYMVCMSVEILCRSRYCISIGCCA